MATQGFDQHRPADAAAAGDDVPDDAAGDQFDTGEGDGDEPAVAQQPAVYGDAAYGSGAFLDLLTGANIAAEWPSPDLEA